MSIKGVKVTEVRAKRIRKSQSMGTKGVKLGTEETEKSQNKGYKCIKTVV